MLNISEIFPNEFYSEAEIYEIAGANYLQVADTQFPTFTVLEVVECFHEMDDPTGRSGSHRYGDCDLDDDDHETLAEFRNDLADGKLFYREA